MSQGIVFYAAILLGLIFLGGLSLGYKGQTALFPLIVIVVGILLTTIKIIVLKKPDLATLLDPQGFFESSKQATPKENKDGDKEYQKKGSNWKIEISIIVWGILFTLCIYVLGFFLASSIFAFLFIRIIGKRPTSIAIVIAAALPGFLYLLFNQLLEIQLHSGIFGS